MLMVGDRWQAPDPCPLAPDSCYLICVGCLSYVARVVQITGFRNIIWRRNNETNTAYRHYRDGHAPGEWVHCHFVKRVTLVTGYCITKQIGDRKMKRLLLTAIAIGAMCLLNGCVVISEHGHPHRHRTIVHRPIHHRHRSICVPHPHPGRHAGPRHHRRHH